MLLVVLDQLVPVESIMGIGPGRVISRKMGKRHTGDTHELWNAEDQLTDKEEGLLSNIEFSSTD